MMPIGTSAASARAAIGASAAAAVAPSNTSRRLIVITKPFVIRELSMKREIYAVKPE
jgi:hypothetical protein